MNYNLNDKGVKQDLEKDPDSQLEKLRERNLQLKEEIETIKLSIYKKQLLLEKLNKE